MSKRTDSDHALICAFSVVEHRFGLDVTHVQEVLHDLEITPVPLAPPCIAGLLNLRGRIVPVADFRRLLDLPDRDPDTPASTVVLRHAGDPLALLVDAVDDIYRADVSTNAQVPETISGVAQRLVTAVVKLPEKLLLVVDPARIVSELRARSRPPPQTRDR